MANKKIGFIGVGMMGHGMAKNLVEKGFPTTILGHHNLAPVEDLVKRGAKEAKDIAGLVAASDIVFICVTGSQQVEDLVYRKGGILESARSGQIVVDTSTSQPGSTLKIAGECKSRGVRFVDAPLTRTPVEAEQGRLNTMVGADAATFKEIEPALKAFCENIFHIGDVGAGHKIKLINNCAAIGQMALIAEALRRARNSAWIEEILPAGFHRRSKLRHLPDAGRQGDRRRFQRHEVQARQCTEGRALLQPDGDGVRSVGFDGRGDAADFDAGGKPRLRRSRASGRVAGSGNRQTQQHAVPTEGGLKTLPPRHQGTKTPKKPSLNFVRCRSDRRGRIWWS
jgi:3-hydroxyisobutyrate dehydrogenase-like beta-hydroxyacid dehydrogenase